MGTTGEDIQMSPAARKKVPYQIECKNKATSQVHTYYAQAKSHGTHEPLVIVKKDWDIALAIVSLEHFLSLLKMREVMSLPDEDLKLLKEKESKDEN